MFGKKNKVHTYISKSYDLENTKDFNEFCGIVDIINEFDFAIDETNIVYGELFNWANIRVKTGQEMMEVWLIKHGFVEV